MLVQILVVSVFVMPVTFVMIEISLLWFEVEVRKLRSEFEQDIFCVA